MPKPSLILAIENRHGSKDDGEDEEYAAMGDALAKAIASKDGSSIYHAVDAIVQECLKRNEGEK